jgi:hypothetical protein
MADATSWQSVAIAAVTGLLTPILAAFLPRLWVGDLRRQQLIAETRVKRLEAVDKAISVAAAAKTQLRIDVSTDDLLSELRRLVHEFASEAVLSKEALEEWAKKPLRTRLQVTPRFTYPPDFAKDVRYQSQLWIASVLCFFMYLPVIFVIRQFSNSFETVSLFIDHNYDLIVYVGYLYIIMLLLAARVQIYRKSASALKAIEGVERNVPDKLPDGEPIRDIARSYNVHNSTSSHLR